MTYFQMRDLENKIEKETGIKVSILPEPYDYSFSIRKATGCTSDEDTRPEMKKLNDWLKKEMGFKTRMGGGLWAIIKVK